MCCVESVVLSRVLKLHITTQYVVRRHSLRYGYMDHPFGSECPNILHNNVEQHQAFETGLKLFDEYLSTATGTTFSGLKLNSIIDSFAPCLMKHLGDEISSIMGLARFDAQIDMAAISQDVAAKAVGRLSKDTVLPFFVTALDKTIDERDFAEFPPIPSIEGMFSRSYWKFAPCSVDRVPKEKPEVTA